MPGGKINTQSLLVGSEKDLQQELNNFRSIIF